MSDLFLSDINGRNATGWTALMYAAHYGHFQVVDELVRGGCDVNAVEPTNGRNALMMAAANGHSYCVEKLVHSGRVDLQARDLNGLTAADHARNCGHGKNSAIIRALQMGGSPSVSKGGHASHRNASADHWSGNSTRRNGDIDQRTTVVRRKPTLVFDSGNSSWETGSLERPLTPFPTASTPQKRDSNPLSRCLFQSGLSSGTENSLPMIGEDSDPSPTFTFTGFNPTDLKRLGVVRLPPRSKARLQDAATVDIDSPPDQGCSMTRLLQERDVLVKKVHRLEEERDFLVNKAEKLEEVIRIFDSMTKNILERVQVNKMDVN